MDFNHSQSQTANRSQPQPEPFIPNHGSKDKKKNLKKRPTNSTVTSLALGLIVVIMIVFGLLWFFRGNDFNEAGQINKKEYQAVFLSNGQVYFGHLDKLNSQYAKLSDIYYLQVKQQVQPKQGTDTSQGQNISLVKLGQELHGPEDAMQINRRQIVFWENLKSDGKVAQAIKSYQDTGGNTTAPTSTPTTNNSATPSALNSSGANSTTNSDNSATEAQSSATQTGSNKPDSKNP